MSGNDLLHIVQTLGELVGRFEATTTAQEKVVNKLDETLTSHANRIDSLEKEAADLRTQKKTLIWAGNGIAAVIGGLFTLITSKITGLFH